MNKCRNLSGLLVFAVPQVSAVTAALPGRAMRRVSSVPSRSHSPGYTSSMSPSRGSLRTSLNSGYAGSPVVTEPKPLSSVFSSTLPSAQRSSNTGTAGSPYSTQKNSPAALRRVSSTNSRSGSASRTTSPYQTSVGSSSGRMGSPLTAMVDGINAPLTKQPCHSSPVRTSMTAVPQHYSSTLPRSMFHSADPYGPQSYDVYERMARPSSLTGRVAKRSSAAIPELNLSGFSGLIPKRACSYSFFKRCFQAADQGCL